MVFGLDDDDRRPLLAIGEVKWGETMGLAHLDRLACFSAAGFTGELRQAAATDSGIVLVGPADLYRPA